MVVDSLALVLTQGTSTITVFSPLTSDPWNGTLFKVPNNPGVTTTNSIVEDGIDNGFEFENNKDYARAGN